MTWSRAWVATYLRQVTTQLPTRWVFFRGTTHACRIYSLKANVDGHPGFIHRASAWGRRCTERRLAAQGRPSRMGDGVQAPGKWGLVPSRKADCGTEATSCTRQTWSGRGQGKCNTDDFGTRSRQTYLAGAMQQQYSHKRQYMERQWHSFFNKV